MNGLPPASLRRRLFPVGSAGLRRSRPTRGWVKKIGPGEESLMPSAISAINGAVSTTPIVATTTLSARRSVSDGSAGDAVGVRTSTILMLVTQGLVAELPARNAGAVPPGPFSEVLVDQRIGRHTAGCVAPRHGKCQEGATSAAALLLGRRQLPMQAVTLHQTVQRRTVHSGRAC